MSLLLLFNQNASTVSAGGLSLGSAAAISPRSALASVSGIGLGSSTAYYAPGSTLISAGGLALGSSSAVGLWRATASVTGTSSGAAISFSSAASQATAGGVAMGWCAAVGAGIAITAGADGLGHLVFGRSSDITIIGQA
jgi:hypothetical protein